MPQILKKLNGLFDAFDIHSGKIFNNLQFWHLKS